MSKFHGWLLFFEYDNVIGCFFSGVSYCIDGLKLLTSHKISKLDIL